MISFGSLALARWLAPNAMPGLGFGEQWNGYGFFA
jgi:hypothetical protein